MTTPNRNRKLRCRWFRLRLRTLLVAVAILAVPLAWVGHSLHWIRERRAAFATNRIMMEEPSLRNAPGLLWIFGEQGWSEIWCQPKPGEAEAIGKLFPEAAVAPLMVAPRDLP